MPAGSLITPMLPAMVQSGLRPPSGPGVSTDRPLRVVFADASLQITPQIPSPPARFAVAFGDGSLTITP